MSAPQRTYVVTGVCCATEEAILRRRLDADLGPSSYSFNLLTSELRLQPDVDDRKALAGLRAAGFAGRPKVDVAPPASFLERHSVAIVTAASAALALVGIVSGYLMPLSVVPRILLLAAILTGGWTAYRKAFIALRNRTLDMNVLMTIAMIGALIIDRWDEAAAVIVLFSVSLLLESYSSARTRRAVHSLLAVTPRDASRVTPNGEEIVPLTAVAAGDILHIRPGERIPLDGIVTEGASAVNQSAITGESMPVEKSTGATVYAGSLNQHGTLFIRCTHEVGDTTLAQIVRMIEDAERQRAPVQGFVDRFAAIYTPAVLIAAILVACIPPLATGALWSVWVYRSLVLLVIACPCALVISTPVTLVSAMTNAARHGMLIKGGRYLEALSRVRTIAFDKTGTLTEGRPRVTDIIPLGSVSRNDLLRLVAAIEHRSEHHVAQAILDEASRLQIRFEDVRVNNFTAIPGRGVRAEVAGVPYFLGNHELCEDLSSCSPEVEEELLRLGAEGKTAMVLGRDGQVLGVLGVRDTVRHHAAEVIGDLRKRIDGRIVMLSGDSEESARRIAEEAGVREWRSGLLPAQKVEAIRDLRSGGIDVAMVGDGINDAPALAEATVGIAMGGGGSDLALETADIVLMSDDLHRLPHLVALSRRALAIVRQNIALALALKVIFVVLGVAGLANLWVAILVDDGAALAVILNGLRMLRFRNSD